MNANQTLTDELIEYASNPLFLDSNTWKIERTPYRRSLRPQALSIVELGEPLTAEQFMDYESLAVQRILTTMYEQDTVLLPREPYEGWHDDFKLFYAERSRELVGRLRGHLERYAFSYLDTEIKVSEGWTKERFVEFLHERCEKPEDEPRWSSVIRNSRDPQRAAKMWLIQLAPDFLLESSPMIKNVMGNFGVVQSEWFKIIIDEYGYGVHEKKHSTLFEKTLESVELSSVPHSYWQYYLASALAANNYFHFMGSDHSRIFEYAGALALTEGSLVHFCESAATLLGDVFEGKCDVEYFTEHCHIDDHHGRMALQDVCLPLVETYGEEVIPEMVRGMLCYEQLTEQFDEQFSVQIEWMDSQPDMMELHDTIWHRVQNDSTVPVANLDEHFNELSNSHCHNQDELCHIIDGEMFFFSGYDSDVRLTDGEGVVIRNRRQHGADILSQNGCRYQIYTIGDVKRWL